MEILDGRLIIYLGPNSYPRKLKSIPEKLYRKIHKDTRRNNMKRHYVRTSPFALSTIIDALDTDPMVSNVTVSMEDNDLLVAFDYDKYKEEKVKRKLAQTSGEVKCEGGIDDKF